VTELVKVIEGGRALFTEKTRRGAYGGIFVKGDAFVVGCVAVVLGVGSEVGGAPVSRDVPGAGGQSCGCWLHGLSSWRRFRSEGRSRLVSDRYRSRDVEALTSSSDLVRSIALRTFSCRGFCGSQKRFEVGQFVLQVGLFALTATGVRSRRWTFRVNVGSYHGTANEAVDALDHDQMDIS
jgi:hypothetical protein